MHIRQLRAWLVRLAGLCFREARDRELAEELESHLQMHVEDNIGKGLSPQEARRQALIKLGGVEQTKEKYRSQRGVPMLEDMFQDLRYGARMLLKQPGFTSIAVLTLGLGIGSNTAIFSIVNAVLLRPLPYPAPERLVSLQERVSGGGFSPSYPNFADWRAQSTDFDSMAAVRTNESFNFTGAGEPERLQGRIVSAEFFSTLGISPLLGRDFLAEDDRPSAAPAGRRVHADRPGHPDGRVPRPHARPSYDRRSGSRRAPGSRSRPPARSPSRRTRNHASGRSHGQSRS